MGMDLDDCVVAAWMDDCGMDLDDGVCVVVAFVWWRFLRNFSADARWATTPRLDSMIDVVARVLRRIPRSRRPLFIPAESMGILSDLRDFSFARKLIERNKSARNARKVASPSQRRHVGKTASRRAARKIVR